MIIDNINKQCCLLMNENHSASYIDTKIYRETQYEYPRSAETLKELIAKKHNVSISSVFLVNGIDEAIYLFCSWLKENNGCLVCDIPNYRGILDVIDSINVATVKYNQNPNEYDKELFFAEISKHPNVNAAYLCNPRNPLGNCISAIESILMDSRSQQLIFFLDEAYAEFVNRDKKYIANILRNSEVVIARTFSKAYGLAGIRVGYIMTEQPKFKQYLKKFEIAQPYHISSYSLKTAINALNDTDRMKSAISQINTNRALIIETLEELKIEYYPSSTNFITFAVDDVKGILNYMYSNDLLIAELNSFEMNGHVRVSVGNNEETTRFVNCLKKYYEEAESDI